MRIQTIIPALPLLIGIFLFHAGTTFIIKEGNVEVGRWIEDDGSDEIKIIQEEKPVVREITAAPGEKGSFAGGIRYHEWYMNKRGYEKARRFQPENKLPIFVYFDATWCGVCRQYDKKTFASAKVKKFLAQFPHVKIDGDKDKDLAKKYDVTGYPTFLVLASSGKVTQVKRRMQPGRFIQACRDAGLTLPSRF